jgi:hypothetical protein
MIKAGKIGHPRMVKWDTNRYLKISRTCCFGFLLVPALLHHRPRVAFTRAIALCKLGRGTRRLSIWPPHCRRSRDGSKLVDWALASTSSLPRLQNDGLGDCSIVMRMTVLCPEVQRINSSAPVAKPAHTFFQSG